MPSLLDAPIFLGYSKRMTQTTAEAIDGLAESLGSLLAAHGATVDHLALIHRKIAMLEAARNDAEKQLFYRMAQEVKSRPDPERALVSAYAELKEQLELPFAKNWNAALPISSMAAATRARTAYRYEKNGPGGRSWVGTRPVGDDQHVPRAGIAVVYVLYGADNEPLYLGSTGEFRTRIRTHSSGPIPWVSYMATPCSDREAAYQLEDSYLKTRKPPMNRKAAR